MSPEFVSTRSRIDKLGVKPGAKIAIVGVDDPDFLKELRQRTSDITRRISAPVCVRAATRRQQRQRKNG